MHTYHYTTDQFTCTVGLTPGYFQHSEASIDPMPRFVALWQEIAEAVSKKPGGIWVSAVAQPAVAIYPTERGCPPEGERVVKIQGTRNPAYSPDHTQWRASVLKVIEELKRELEQSTVSVTFLQVELEYSANFS